MSLKNKVAIVTGASRGLGHEFARALAREGAAVALVARSRDEIEHNAAAIVAAGGAAIAVPADLSDPDAARAIAGATAAAFGGIDILVNNAAIYAGYVRHNLVEQPLDDWNRFLAVNVTSVLLCTQAVVPHMEARGRGKVINISSAAGNLAANQYAISKLAVQGLTVGLARSLGPRLINVNCIAPGVIDTAATLEQYPRGEVLDALVARMTVIPRVGTPEDLTGALIFLAGEGSDYLTGQILHVDGGAITWPV